MKPDVIVVGAGVIGMMTARELSLRGLRVHIYERGRAGQESSWAGGGILAPIPPWQAHPAVQVLAAAGAAIYPGLSQELGATGIDIEYLRSGVLQLGETPGREALAWANRSGEPIEALSGAALRETEPGLGEAFDEAIFLPRIAQLRNPRLVQALYADLRRRAVAIFENRPVSGFARHEGKVVGVHTATGVGAAGSVVVACGAWSGALTGAPVRPVRGQMLWYQARPGLVSKILIEADQYLIPRQDGICLVGSTVEESGFDKSTSDAAARRLHEVAVRLCPALAKQAPVGQWAGLRPGSPDGIPFICAVPAAPGLWVNAGHFRNGLTLAPGSAQLMADLLTGSSPAVDPNPYRLPDQLYS